MRDVNVGQWLPLVLAETPAVVHPLVKQAWSVKPRYMFDLYPTGGLQQSYGETVMFENAHGYLRDMTLYLFAVNKYLPEADLRPLAQLITQMLDDVAIKYDWEKQLLPAGAAADDIYSMEIRPIGDGYQSDPVEARGQVTDLRGHQRRFIEELNRVNVSMSRRWVGQDVAKVVLEPDGFICQLRYVTEGLQTIQFYSEAMEALWLTHAVTQANLVCQLYNLLRDLVNTPKVTAAVIENLSKGSKDLALAFDWVVES